MDDLRVIVAKTEEVAASAHKRLDKQELEIDSLRVSRHKMNGQLQNHNGLLTGMESAVKDLVAAAKLNTQAVLTLRVMAYTAIVMGTGFITICSFVGGKLLKIW